MGNRNRPLVDNFGSNVGVGTTVVPRERLQVGGHVTPDTNLSYSLGLPTAYWSSSYVGTMVSTRLSASLFSASVVTSLAITTSMVDFISASNPPYAESTIFYDWAEHTLAVYNDNNQITHNLGQENLVRVYNPSVGALPAGMPVYISNSNALGFPQIIPAIAPGGFVAGSGSMFNVAGVTSGYISGSAYGYITTVGIVHGLTQSWAAGTPLWLSYLNSGSYLTNQPPGTYEKHLVGIIIQSGSTTGTDLLVLPNPHTFGATSASVAVSASRAEFSEQASQSLALYPWGRYAVSYISSSDGSYSGSFRGYLSGSATSASYIATCSVAILAYTAQTADFALDSMYAWSSSYAQTCSVYEVNFLTSSVESSSFASQSFSASYVPLGRSIVLCAGYTPVLPGADIAEYVIPYHPQGDGTVPLDWNIKRFTIRAQTIETSQSVVNIEKFSGSGIFVGTVVGSLTLPALAYEAYSSSFTSASLTSGDKIRFNVVSLGTSQNWTIITEISNA